MAFPVQLKTARSSNATPVSSVDNVIGELESALADLLDVPLNTNLNEPVSGGRAKYAQIADSNTVANTTTQTAFDKSYSIPANTLAVGNIIRLHAWGVNRLATGTCTLRVRIGGGQVMIVSLPFAAIGVDVWWDFKAAFIVRSIGASGSIQPGRPMETIYGAASLETPVGPVTVDTTIARVLDLTVEWSAANVGNTITMRGLVVEILPASSTS
jgi:hypothetical protein